MRLFLICWILSVAFAVDLGGKWSGEMTVTGRTRKFTMALRVEGPKLLGTIGDETERVELIDGRVNGNEIAFGIPSGAKDMPRFDCRGSSDGETINFTISGVDWRGNEMKLGEGHAKRLH